MQGPRWARTMARAMVALSGVPLRVEGKERVAGALPAVVVANHASYVDAILLAAMLPPDIKFVATRRARRSSNAAASPSCLRPERESFLRRFKELGRR